MTLLPIRNFHVRLLITCRFLGLPATPAHGTKVTVVPDRDPVIAHLTGIMIAHLNIVMEGPEGLRGRIVPIVQPFRQTAIASEIPFPETHREVPVPSWTHLVAREVGAYQATFAGGVAVGDVDGAMTVAIEAEIVTLISGTGVIQLIEMREVASASVTGGIEIAIIFAADGRHHGEDHLLGGTSETPEMLL
jgi:hypothetical protein